MENYFFGGGPNIDGCVKWPLLGVGVHPPPDYVKILPVCLVIETNSPVRWFPGGKNPDTHWESFGFDKLN